MTSNNILVGMPVKTEVNSLLIKADVVKLILVEGTESSTEIRGCVRVCGVRLKEVEGCVGAVVKSEVEIRRVCEIGEDQ